MIDAVIDTLFATIQQNAAFSHTVQMLLIPISQSSPVLNQHIIEQSPVYWASQQWPRHCPGSAAVGTAQQLHGYD